MRVRWTQEEVEKLAGHIRLGHSPRSIKKYFPKHSYGALNMKMSRLRKQMSHIHPRATHRVHLSITTPDKRWLNSFRASQGDVIRAAIKLSIHSPRLEFQRMLGERWD